MDTIVFPNPETSTPYACLVYPGLDSIEDVIEKVVDPLGVDYAIVDESTIPDSSYITEAMTVSINGGSAQFDWDLALAKQLALSYNSHYWQKQYNQGLLQLAISNPYQLSLAVATPPEERTADQVAAVEYMVGLNGLQTDVENQIATATTGQEIIGILGQLG